MGANDNGPEKQDIESRVINIKLNNRFNQMKNRYNQIL